MTPEQESKLWEYVGNSKRFMEDLEKRLNGLPCSAESRRLEKIEAWQNQTIGKISIISLVCGAVGWGIVQVVSYFMGRN